MQFTQLALWAPGEIVTMGNTDHQLDEKRRKPRTTVNQESKSDGWRGFVNIELSDAQKKAVKATLDKMGDHWALIMELVEEGYKLSLSWDEAHTSYVLSMTCRVKGHDDEGLTLTARGGTYAGAQAAFVYKHQIVLKGRWYTASGSGGRGMDVDDVG